MQNTKPVWKTIWSMKKIPLIGQRSQQAGAAKQVYDMRGPWLEDYKRGPGLKDYKREQKSMKNHQGGTVDFPSQTLPADLRAQLQKQHALEQQVKLENARSI